MARELKMLIDDGPPHMITATKNGIDVDITRNILVEMGYSVEVDIASLKRSMMQVAQKRADIFLPTFFHKDTDELYISNAYINYKPTAFTLKKNKLTLNNIADLSSSDLISFQGATGYFGPEFVKASKLAKYRELHDMSKFPEMLIKGRCDVVVLDYYIFYYFLREYLKNNPNENFTAKEIQTVTLFPEVEAHVGFNDPSLRDNFNQTLKLFKQGNKEKEIIESYLGLLGQN